MEGNYPIAREEAVHGIVSAILLSIVTCGIYSLFWRAKQFRTINAWLGREEHSFLKYFLLTIVTCGIYGIYYEYKYAVTMVETQRMHSKETNDSLPLLSILLTIFGLSIVVWAIEQTEINSWYGAGDEL